MLEQIAILGNPTERDLKGMSMNMPEGITNLIGEIEKFKPKEMKDLFPLKDYDVRLSNS